MIYMPNWKSSDEDEEKKPMFTKEQVKGWIEKGKKREASNICAGVYGDPGTGKTGVAMDTRTDEDIEEGKKIYIIDVDGGCGSIKGKYFPNDEDIIIFDPLEDSFDDEGSRDAPLIYNKINAFTKYIYNNQDELNMHSVILDGVDKFQDICGDKMQIEDLNKDPNARVKNSWNWQIRNRYYKDVMEKIKKMDCHRFFITHMKDKKKAIDGELQVIDEEINWHHSTDGMLHQMVYMYREEEDGKECFKARIEKSKGALNLEGKEYVVAEVDHASDKEPEWYGLKEFWDEAQ